MHITASKIIEPCVPRNSPSEKLGVLQLANGMIFIGFSFGAEKAVSGECVFQTGMVGYIESLTDPSYEGQILTLTYPLIGNYGVPDFKAVDKFQGLTESDISTLPKYAESSKIHVTALVVSQYCHDYSHGEALYALSDWLKHDKIVGLYGIDTRMLTKILRAQGCLLGKISIIEHSLEELRADHSDLYPILDSIPFFDPNISNIVKEVSVKFPITYTPEVFDPLTHLSIVAMDLGIKSNQIRCFLKRNVRVTVVPWDYDFLPDLQSKKYHGLFISNGPGDPVRCIKSICNIRKAVETPSVPIFGICLGHQLLALAIGATTSKLPFGNRGHNIPCRDIRTGRCYITSQNHGFAVNVDTLPRGWKPLFTNMNDNSNEGIISDSHPFFSVQFHPEAFAGPQDTEFLFDEFIQCMSDSRGKSLKNIKHSCSKHVEYCIHPVKRCLILGSGGLSIGQAGEFDYSGSQAIKALKEEGIQIVLINPNIATIQTSQGLADKVYFLPINREFVKQVIELEKPDSIFVTFGGQTALNVGVELRDEFDGLNVQVLGTPIEAIMATEDRDIFAKKLSEIDERIAPSFPASTLEEAFEAADKIGYPVIIRAAYALGGLGSGFADNQMQLGELCVKAFSISPQILVERSLKGWKEIEYEVVRDAYDNCITVCNMENFDPLGIHTGDSIVIAPSQTLSNSNYQMLRNTAIKVVRHIGVIGECNIQYALNPENDQYCIIEVNARLSRSSALASKATGYPLAFVAAKLGLGKRLDEVINTVTQRTTACFEPSLDYCVVKLPRWDLKKFSKINNKINSAMKSIGEVMSIGRTFEEALQKGIRALDVGIDGFIPWNDQNFQCLNSHERLNLYEKTLKEPSDERLFILANAFSEGFNVERIYQLTKIDRWFLKKLYSIYYFGVNFLKAYREVSFISYDDLLNAKRLGFSDKWIALATRRSSELLIRKIRKSLGICPFFKQIDTVAGEFPCFTNYLYSSYNASEHDISFLDSSKQKSIFVLGSGVYRIGSSVEFDWCGVRCVRTLKKLGYYTILMNCNPETVSTDFDEVDRLYFDTIFLEGVLDIYDIESPLGIVISTGGQIPNNLALPLFRQGVPILGTNPESIDQAENRYKFSRLLDSLNIDQPQWKELLNLEAAIEFCSDVGYPVLVRPSYVLSGAAMKVVYTQSDLSYYLDQAVAISKDQPVVISKFIEGAKEIEFDGVSNDGELVKHIISEHVENAGVHSGDATLILPPQDLDADTIARVEDASRQITWALRVTGPLNIQFLAKDGAIKVIECNLRSSRSFPFVSKVLNCDLIEMATYCLVGRYPEYKSSKKALNSDKSNMVAVKVSQFSFGRLSGADPVLGVEMASTGEVACFGSSKYDAYLKALISTSFRIPSAPSSILLSIGSYKEKLEFLPYALKLTLLGYNLFATPGTADFLSENGISVSFLEVVGDDAISSITKEYDLQQHLSEKKISLYINLPSRSHYRRPANYLSRGYKSRRLAIDMAIPLITNVKCAKLFVEALSRSNGDLMSFLKVKKEIDCKQDLMTIYDTVDISDLSSVENPFYGKSIINASDFSRSSLHMLFSTSQKIQNIIQHDNSYPELLKGKLAVLAFFEPSTRTANSFEAAVIGLGGKTIRFQEAGSSTQKGETLEDTIKSLSNYSHLMIIRHYLTGISKFLSDLISPIPLINAGDGDGEHPTQAMLDLFTIRQELGTINGLTIVFVGDLKYSRTVHSLLHGLSLYNGITIIFVAIPGRELSEQWLRGIFGNRQMIKLKSYESFEDALPRADVVYMTRLQKERTPGIATCYPESLKLTPRLLSLAKDKMIIMHPLPRNDEISTDIDLDHRATYFRQTRYGLFVRMALVYLMLTKVPSI